MESYSKQYHPSVHSVVVATSKPFFQPKLIINNPNDPYEQEADAVADEVMKMETPSVQKKSDADSFFSPSPVTITPIQRKCAHCEEEEKEKTPRIQKKEFSVNNNAVVSDNILSEIQSTKGSGSVMNAATKNFMESNFGTDFSNVYIHTDNSAAALSAQLNAKAFTVGNDIYFNRGKYAVENTEGKHLLAHELTHVVQQKATENVIYRDVDSTDEDPQSKLSQTSMKRWQQFYDEIGSAVFGNGLLGELGRAEQVSPSITRRDFFGELGGKISAQLGNVTNDEQLAKFEQAFDDWKKRFYDTTTKAGEEWLSIKSNYEAELLRLIDDSSLPGFYSLKYLRENYTETVVRINKINTSNIVTDDFITLRGILKDDAHVWYGELQAARKRNAEINEMLKIVGELKRTGQDADKLVPLWSEKYTDEAARLKLLALTAPKDYQGYFKSLFATLNKNFTESKSAHPRTKGIAEKGFDLVSGAVSAITDPFIEAGKQVIDLGQIAVHFASFSYYKPKFISDVGKAAEKGASTTDILEGMALGLIETPKRLYDAIDKGDWEAIGRESVNIYLMAKMGKEGLAKAGSWIKILRARMAGLEGGISASAALEALALAKKENLVIRFRPTDAASVALREAGYPAKPEFLKMKTIKAVDVALGAGEADIGKVGYFEPKMPAEFEKLSPKRRAEITERYKQRMDEWNNKKWRKEIADYEKRGVLKHEDGVIIDAATGKAYTGDYDLFDIRRGSLAGESVEFESLSPETQAKLRAKPIEVQHGAHLDWKEIPAGAAEGYADIVLNARKTKGAKALIEFHPDGRISYAFFID